MVDIDQLRGGVQFRAGIVTERMEEDIVEGENDVESKPLPLKLARAMNASSMAT